MTATQIGLLTLQVGLVVTSMSFLTAWLIRSRQEKYKFKLYAIRDELIYLVANEQLSESSAIFKALYSTINLTLAEVHDVDRWSFIRASTRARTAFEEARIEELFNEICDAPLPVLEVTQKFIDTMLLIAKANSPITKLCIACVKLFKSRGSALSGWLEKAFLPKEQYENYRYFRRLSLECHQPL